ncbi:RNA 2',3'-cyclic phosphodiesterase [Methanolacinia paynteri]|uniref:RNA 2',3'-cyclic phosphodiesterase n=1 Tax=Methanolacinia paynteri TaxID=230356 RepID=UPI00064EF3DA|nr:RNA 2',3'-cyclic phosphodiesterase [Methanolacinia paynteri]
MVRVFIAVEIPEEFRLCLGEVQNELKFSKAHLNFVDPAIAHITIKFIGEVAPDKVTSIKRALEDVKFSPYEVAFRGIFFNNPSRPRVIWTPGYDGSRSSDLKVHIEDLLEPEGILREKRKFQPHVTLARIKRFHPSLAESVASFGDFDFGSFKIESIVLKSSILKPEGPVYDDLMEVEF